MKKLLLVSLLVLAACSAPKEVPPPLFFPPINPAAMPRPVNLKEVNTYVVTSENFEDFATKFSSDTGRVTFIAMSTEDFQNMTFNLAELRRYINQQKAVIVYYQKSIEDLQKLNTYPTD